MNTEDLKKLIKEEIDKMCFYLEEGETITVDEVQDCIFMFYGLPISEEVAPEAFTYIKSYLCELGVYEDITIIKERRYFVSEETTY